MQGFQCECGAVAGSNTGESFAACDGCEKCKMTLAHSPSGHKPLQPHKFAKRYDEKTGKLAYYRCLDCHARMKAYDADGKLVPMPS